MTQRNLPYTTSNVRLQSLLAPLLRPHNVLFQPCRHLLLLHHLLPWQVRLWNLQSGTCDVTLSGHKGSVTALKYNLQGGMLASGAQDTDIIVWDVAAESGLCRLRGHQDQVTDLVSHVIPIAACISPSTPLLSDDTRGLCTVQQACKGLSHMHACKSCTYVTKSQG